MCHLSPHVTTTSHPNSTPARSDNGIIRTLHVPIYLTKIKGSQVHCLDREVRARIMNVDVTEFRFKLALVNRKYDEV